MPLAHIFSTSFVKTLSKFYTIWAIRRTATMLDVLLVASTLHGQNFVHTLDNKSNLGFCNDYFMQNTNDCFSVLLWGGVKKKFPGKNLKVMNK